MRAFPGTPSVVDTYGHTLTFKECCAVLKIGKTAALRKLEAGTFPVPPLPRQFNEPYRFAARQVDRYLSREMAAPNVRLRA